MTSSPAVTSFFSSQDPLSSVSLAHQTRPSTFDWTQSHELTKDFRENDDRPEHRSQHLNTAKEPSATPPTRRPSAGLQKLSFSPSPLMLSHQTVTDAMKSNPKSAAPREPFVYEDSSDPVGSGLRRLGNRWSFNGSEKIPESAIANWDLVDEIGRLQIGNGGEDGTERTMTPPKNSTSEILQIHETSPLDTSSSDASLESISPPDEDRLTLPSHSRGSSTDTSSSDNSSLSHTLMPSFKSPAISEVTKDRPRSFSGAYSDADLRRLQQAGTQDQSRAASRDKRSSPSSGGEEAYNLDNINQQPMFPSLTTYPHAMQSTPTVGHGAGQVSGPRQDEPQVDHNLQLRQFANPGQVPYAPIPPSGPARHIQPDPLPYRQSAPPRAVNVFQPHMQIPAQGPPALLPTPNNFGYPGHPNAHSHHNSHLSLGNTQQLYEMMLPPVDTGVARTQQTFRGTHHHSASDPATLRDAAALLLSNGMHSMQGAPFPGPTPGMYAPMGLPAPNVYPNQFYPGPSLHAQEAYNQEMINALGRVLPQYTANGMPSVQTQYGVATNQTGGSNGPSANNRKLGLYKTELCRSWEEKGTCRYGPKCQFAHGEDEIRKVARHPKYKTEICRTFWVSGSCPYGKRCCFIHTELPASGAPPGADGNPPPPVVDGRARSMSTNSDPNEAPVSLLARISAKRNQDPSTPTTTTPVGSQESHSSQSSYQFSKPPTGALRVDTTVLDNTGAKQNKSAYPSFASNAVQAISPGPVTAGPDFGRHNSIARVNMIDINQGRVDRSGSSNSNPRHSFNGAEAGITLNAIRSASGSASPFNMLTSESPSSSAATSGHGHGHSRSGSAGNWGSFSSHKGHLAAPSPYSHSPSPGNDVQSNNASSPWGTTEVNRPWA